MSTGDPTSQGVLGFLSVLEHDQLGLVGGYLLLNASGRPLEFHCTAPVKPNRAQQILFGPTLDSFLYGEQIGQTLVTKSTLAPVAVCTDVERALAVREFISLPVALVLGSGETTPETPAAESATTTSWRVDHAHRPALHLMQFAVGRHRLAVSAGRDADRQTIAQRFEQVATFDLCEPFTRIREAVEEAHRGGRV